MRKLLLPLFVLLLAPAALAQYPTRRVYSGPTPPATCQSPAAYGATDIYIDSNAPTGSRFLVCEGGVWVAPGGSGAAGDVTGPSSSVDSELAVFNSTTGKVIKRFTGTGLVLSTSGVGSVVNTSAGLAGALSDETGSGALVLGTAPTIDTPTIASFANANHSHQNSAGGGTLDAAAIGAGTLAVARGGTGSAFFTVAGPTATRTYTFPDASATIARTDAAQTFAGVQTFSGNILASTDGGINIGAAAASRPHVFAYGLAVNGATSTAGEARFGTGSNAVRFPSGLQQMGSAVQLNWSSGDPTAAATDVGLRRTAAGELSVTNGSTGTGNLTAARLLSTAATGTAPLAVASTTPVANLNAHPLTYNAAGTQQANAKIVIDFVTLSAGTASVTFTGSAVFTSASSYMCAPNNASALNAVRVTKVSGTQITVTGTGTDIIGYICVGN
jgi:hypothetical protein